jgi:hypothetical protein
VDANRSTNPFTQIVVCMGTCVESVGQPRLLFALLQREGKAPPDQPMRLENSDLFFPQSDGSNLISSFQRFLITATKAVDPKFKVLIYPFRVGDPLPVATWVDLSVVNVTFSDFQALIRFNYSESTGITTVERLNSYVRPATSKIKHSNL